MFQARWATRIGCQLSVLLVLLWPRKVKTHSTRDTPITRRWVHVFLSRVFLETIFVADRIGHPAKIQLSVSLNMCNSTFLCLVECCTDSFMTKKHENSCPQNLRSCPWKRLQRCFFHARQGSHVLLIMMDLDVHVLCFIVECFIAFLTAKKNKSSHAKSQKSHEADHA